ncbi:MAG: ribonuclease P protein component [Phycisphaerales bacterium]|nr:ribonuclease P protein component [Phycisphaerales bacterium]
MPSAPLTKSMQLTHNRDYQRVYAARACVSKGPLRISAAPREEAAAPTRFGLSVPGRVGTNVKRNRIKRRIREAFRLNREKMPGGFDFVIGVHPHEEKAVEEYASLLLAAAEALAAKGGKKNGK